MQNSTTRISFDIAQLCNSHGVHAIVVSPGSRNAPLAMAFQQTPEINCLSIIDERSAAFFALGMAQATQKPTAVCCTSGTALLNYYPAVAEAFYQEQPLLVISADRPLEKIDQQIGQSIRQDQVYSTHLGASYQLVEASGDEGLIAYNQRIINEALIELTTRPYGPVHLNVPLREPLYEAIEPPKAFPKLIHASHPELHLSENTWSLLLEEWKSYEKILVLAGMFSYDPTLSEALIRLARESSLVVVADWVSGVTGEGIYNEIDKILHRIVPGQEEPFIPDLVLSYGNGLVSKKIKQLLGSFPPKAHWHIHPQGKVVDTYECLSRVIKAEPHSFFEKLSLSIPSVSSSFSDVWKEAYTSAQAQHTGFLVNAPFSDLKVFEVIHTHIPRGWALHLGNSSVIRYMQMFPKPEGLACWGNRGTSGIDGGSSTAIGYAFASNHPCLLISGDVSFFYDSNAWWNAYVSPEFRAIVINNGGGGIFRLINGPSKGGVLESFQETPHQLTAEYLAASHGMGYQRVDNEPELREVLKDFFLPSTSAQIVEVFTPRLENAPIWQTYLKALSENKLESNE